MFNFLKKKRSNYNNCPYKVEKQSEKPSTDIDIKQVGCGDVVLIAGGGQVYTDIAARFVRSERDLKDIVASPYDENIVRNILNSGHMAATEFDYFIFGVQSFSRVCEVQLVRKRIASYLIKSGRAELHGKRRYSVVVPDSIRNHNVNSIIRDVQGNPVEINVSIDLLTQLTNEWYTVGIQKGLKEEDLRYMKQQATEFKAIIGMNARSLHEFFARRCCLNAQYEIRTMANKMLHLVKENSPVLFEKAGAACVSLGYCPENKYKNAKCNKLTHDDVLNLIKSSIKN